MTKIELLDSLIYIMAETDVPEQVKDMNEVKYGYCLCAWEHRNHLIWDLIDRALVNDDEEK